MPKEYLPDSLLHDNYFMNQWYKNYYPHYYERWKRDNSIEYKEEGDFLVKKVNNVIEKQWHSPICSLQYLQDKTLIYESNNYFIQDIYHYSLFDQRSGFCYEYWTNNLYNIYSREVIDNGIDRYEQSFDNVDYYRNNDYISIISVHGLDSEEMLFLVIANLGRKGYISFYTRNGCVILGNDSITEK